MSGRVSPHDVIAALYRAVDDHHLPWLDDLMIAAGLMRRCRCGTTAPADERCERCGLSDGEPDMPSFFDTYRYEPEATYDTPPLCDGEVPVQIRIAAAGGGSVGAAYANNDWIYDVLVDGRLVCSGTDLRSGSIPHTHRQMAAMLAGDIADTDDVPALRTHLERLSLWANDTPREWNHP